MKKCWDLLTDVTELDGDFFGVGKGGDVESGEFLWLAVAVAGGKNLKRVEITCKAGYRLKDKLD